MSQAIFQPSQSPLNLDNGEASPRRKAYLMRSSTLQQMPNSSYLNFNQSPITTNTDPLSSLKLTTEISSPSKFDTPLTISPHQHLYTGPRKSECVQSGGLMPKLVAVDDDDDEDYHQINEFNDNNHNESLSYKRSKEKQYFVTATKRNPFMQLPPVKLSMKHRSGSSRSISRGTTPIRNKEKLLDLSNTSIMESVRSRNVSFRIGHNGKLKRQVGSPVSVNSRLCGGESFHNFEDFYELYQSQEESVFMDTEILAKILEFLDPADVVQMSRLTHSYRNDKTYQKVFHKRLYVFFGKGFEKKDQVLFWNSLIHFRQKRKDYPFAYSSNFAKKCPHLKEIKKDVDRTLPEYDKFSTEEGKAALLRLLVSISNTVKDMGYMQGLNSIAGMFLFYLKEEESFWILLYFMEKMKFKNFLKDDFTTINTLTYQLDLYLEHYLPDLAEHFRSKNTKPAYFVTTWFLTLFSYNLNVANTIKVWNFLCLRGSAFLIQFTLAIFDKYKQSIMTMDIDEVSYFLKNELRELPDNETTLFEMAIKFKVTRRLLKEAEVQFNYGKPQMQLVIDLYGKQEWVGGKDVHSESFRIDGSPLKLAKVSSTKEIIDSFLNTLTVGIPGSIHEMFKKKDGALSRKNSEASMSRILPERMDTDGFEHERINTLQSEDPNIKGYPMSGGLNSKMKKGKRRNSRSISKSKADIDAHNESNEEPSFGYQSGGKVKFSLPKLQLHRRGNSSAASLPFRGVQTCRGPSNGFESDRGGKSIFALNSTRTRVLDNEEALTPTSDANFMEWTIPQSVYDALKEGAEKQKLKTMSHRGRVPDIHRVHS